MKREPMTERMTIAKTETTMLRMCQCLLHARRVWQLGAYHVHAFIADTTGFMMAVADG